MPIADADLAPEAMAQNTFGDVKQRRELQQEITALENRLYGRQRGMPVEMQGQAGMTGLVPFTYESLDGETPADAGELEESLLREKATLAQMTPPTLTPAQRTRVEQTVRDLQADLRDGLMTHDDLERPTAGNVQTFLRQQQQMKTAMLAYRQYRRLLDPDATDPYIASFEPLRRHTAPRGNPAAFRAGYEQIEWSAPDGVDALRQEMAALKARMEQQDRPPAPLDPFVQALQELKQRLEQYGLSKNAVEKAAGWKWGDMDRRLSPLSSNPASVEEFMTLHAAIDTLVAAQQAPAHEGAA